MPTSKLWLEIREIWQIRAHSKPIQAVRDRTRVDFTGMLRNLMISLTASLIDYRLTWFDPLGSASS